MNQESMTCIFTGSLQVKAEFCCQKTMKICWKERRKKSGRYRHRYILCCCCSQAGLVGENLPLVKVLFGSSSSNFFKALRARDVSQGEWKICWATFFFFCMLREISDIKRFSSISSDAERRTKIKLGKFPFSAKWFYVYYHGNLEKNSCHFSQSPDICTKCIKTLIPTQECFARVIHDFGKDWKSKCIPAFWDHYGIRSSELKEWAGYRRSFYGLNWAKFTS